MNYPKMSLFVPVLLLPALLLGPSVAALAQAPDPSAPENQFFKIGVQHYDAGMMADLVTRQDAIVVVPPNFVILDAGTAPRPAQNALPNAGTNALPPAPANNRLPDGVQRIYALRADNSLVIQTAPDLRYRPSITSPITPPISQKGSTP